MYPSIPSRWWRYLFQERRYPILIAARSGRLWHNEEISGSGSQPQIPRGRDSFEPVKIWTSDESYDCCLPQGVFGLMTYILEKISIICAWIVISYVCSIMEPHFGYMFCPWLINVPCTGHVFKRPQSLEQNLSDSRGGFGCLWSWAGCWGRYHLSNHPWKQGRLVIPGTLAVFKPVFFLFIQKCQCLFVYNLDCKFSHEGRSNPNPMCTNTFSKANFSPRSQVPTLNALTEEHLRVPEKRTLVLRVVVYATFANVGKVWTGKICSYLCAPTFCFIVIFGLGVCIFCDWKWEWNIYPYVCTSLFSMYNSFLPLYMDASWCFTTKLFPRKAAEKAMECAHTTQGELPWERECPLTMLLLHDNVPNGKAKFHLLDIWHCVHLGIGKSWVASGAMMLSKLIPESSNDKRLAVLGQKYVAFCRTKKLDPYLRKIDIHTFGGPGAKERNGAWNKAAVTSNFMQFLESFCEEEAEKVNQQECLRIFVSCLKWYVSFLSIKFLIGVMVACVLVSPCMSPILPSLIEAFGTQQLNLFFSGIYKEDGIMKREVGKKLGDALQNFITAYLWESSDAYKKGVAAFPLYPKLHACHEIAFRMRLEARLYPFVQNPAVHACATDEDFIGRMAALSRCVSPMKIPLRTVQRYLCHLHILWARAWKEKWWEECGLWVGRAHKGLNRSYNHGYTSFCSVLLVFLDMLL